MRKSVVKYSWLQRERGQSSRKLVKSVYTLNSLPTKRLRISPSEVLLIAFTRLSGLVKNTPSNSSNTNARLLLPTFLFYRRFSIVRNSTNPFNICAFVNLSWLKIRMIFSSISLSRFLYTFSLPNNLPNIRLTHLSLNSSLSIYFSNNH